MNLISRFVRDESGATAIEYGLIAALIAVVIITGVTAVGTGLSTTFTGVNGRRYAVDGTCEFVSTVADGAFVFKITDSSNTQQKRSTGPVTSTASITPPPLLLVRVGTGASLTYKLRLARATGTGTYTMNASSDNSAYIRVMDIGPLTGTAPAS